MGTEISLDAVEKSRSLRVLIVDDEPLIRWSISETLRETGHAVTEAQDGKETLQRLATEPPPDVILLDYRLADSDDLRLLETIRRVVPRSRVVMMTAFSTPAVQAGAVALGVFCVVAKPFEMGELTPLLQKAYESRN